MLPDFDATIIGLGPVGSFAAKKWGSNRLNTNNCG